MTIIAEGVTPICHGIPYSLIDNIDYEYCLIVTVTLSSPRISPRNLAIVPIVGWRFAVVSLESNNVFDCLRESLLFFMILVTQRRIVKTNLTNPSLITIKDAIVKMSLTNRL